MTDLFKNLDKYIKDWHILTFLGLLVLGYVIYEYNGKQNLLVSNYQGVNQPNLTPSPVAMKPASGSSSSMPSMGGQPTANDPLQDSLNGPALVNQVPSTIQPVPTNNGGNQQGPMDPNQLLPRDTNSQWVQNQSVSPGMNGMNLLDSRSLSIGMQSQTLRNANQQLRADPVIASGPAPCFQSTISKDDTGVGLSVC